jgi:hypothetical protein
MPGQAGHGKPQKKSVALVPTLFFYTFSADFADMRHCFAPIRHPFAIRRASLQKKEPLFSFNRKT